MNSSSRDQLLGYLLHSLDPAQREQVESELPYYGEWKARQAVRHSDGLDVDFLALLAASTRLARIVQAGVGPAGSGGQGSAGEGDDKEVMPEAALARIKELEAAYRETKDHWDRLVAEFQVQASGLATAGGSGRWRACNAASLRQPIRQERRYRKICARFRRQSRNRLQPRHSGRDQMARRRLVLV